MEDSKGKEEGIRMYRGIFLEGGKMRNLYDKELMEFMAEFEISSIHSHVDDKPSSLDYKAKSTIFSRIRARTHDWRVLRKMKEHNANFLLMQISNTKIYYDYCWAD